MEKKKINLKTIGQEKLLLLLIAGIALVAFSYPMNSITRQASSNETLIETKTQEDEEELSSYEQQLEEKLVQTLSGVSGVGKVKVMVTLKSTAEKVVNKDISSESKKTGDDTQFGDSSYSSNQSTVLSDNSNTPYVIKEILPEIEGVAVVAEGAGQIGVKSEIYDTVQALFGVPLHKIKVLKGDF